MIDIVLPSKERLERSTPKRQVELAIESLNFYEERLHEELKEVAKLKMRIAVLLASGKDLKDLEAEEWKD